MKTLILSLLFAASIGSEFQINTRTSQNQANADIATNQNGNFIVVWSSYYTSSGRSNDIYGRLFDPNCSPIGDEFQINSNNSGNQTMPSVAMDSSGNFIVAWHGPGLTDEDEEDIFARCFDANSSPAGQEFMVNSFTNDSQQYPQIAVSENGNFIIVWESVNFPEEGNRTICGRLFNKDGTSIGEEFIINEEPSDCRYPDVALDSNDGFAVVWMKNASTNSILAKLFNDDCSARTNSFQASSIGFSSITNPAIAMEGNGRFIITWDGDPNRAGDDYIHARIFDADGAPTSEQFTVNTETAGAQQNPHVAVNDHGRFIIAWDSKTDPNDNRNVLCRRFTGSGNPTSNDIRLNTTIEADQKCPAVAIGQDDFCITIWQSDEQDGSGWGVFGCADTFVNSADANLDGFVDLIDYSIFTKKWLNNERPLTADLSSQNQIGYELVSFCEQWLTSICYE